VMSGSTEGPVAGAARKAWPRSPHARPAPASPRTNGARALEWLELAQGTTLEALAERLAQAHLMESQSVPAEEQ
jgi:hypothetical protein